MAVPAPIDDAVRYSRQVLFPGIGAEGQRRLGLAHAAIIGVGATGAATASLLARAGVGHLTLIDRDFVEPSNLQRQILFDEADARDSLPKATAAARHIARFNASIHVTAHVADLVPASIPALLPPPADGGPTLLLDCTDNFETRYLLNDLAVRDRRPWIYAAAVGAYAATLNILPGQTPCLACLFPTPPAGPVETCDTAGILATAVNLAASLQSTEALKLLAGRPELLRRSLLSWDLWTGRHAEIAAHTPRPDCTVCGPLAHPAANASGADARRFRHLAGDARPHITLCGRNAVQIHEHARPIDLEALAHRLAPLGPVRWNGLLLRFDTPPHTLTVFPDGRALIQGTTDPGIARSLYARFLGS